MKRGYPRGEEGRWPPAWPGCNTTCNHEHLQQMRPTSRWTQQCEHRLHWQCAADRDGSSAWTNCGEMRSQPCYPLACAWRLGLLRGKPRRQLREGEAFGTLGSQQAEEAAEAEHACHWLTPMGCQPSMYIARISSAYGTSCVQRMGGGRPVQLWRDVCMPTLGCEG